MQIGIWSKRAILGASILALFSAASARADDAAGTQTDVAAELKALKTRIAELEAKQNDNWLTEEAASQIRGIVEEVLADAKQRGQFADGPEIGYKDGFYIQTADKNFKLVLGGFVQVRYEYAQANATNGRTLPPRTGSGSGSVPVTPSDPGNSSGFDIRRARLSFGGNIFSPDLTFKFEGDFYGSSSGSFTVTDAWAAYRFTDQFKVKLGSFKVPFAKAELTTDTLTSMAERPEELVPFDPVRSLGVSLYGDLIKDQLSYEVNVNDGGNANTLRRDDTIPATSGGITPNLDNRLAFYARMQWAGAGKLSDFTEETDLRADNRDFIWMLGAAAGYESQNASNTAFPSPQTTGTVPGLSGDSGFISTYNLNGDLFRGTLDWSAKYQGLSLLAAGYIQQVNANAGNISSTSGAPPTVGPYGAANSSFFEWGGYGQFGYFVIPQKLELVGRAGLLLTEGFPNYGEFYSAGANYYIYGQNVKIVSDVTYSPEAAFTDNATSLVQNTHDLIFRIQLQLKF